MSKWNFKRAFAIAAGLTLGYEFVTRLADVVFILLNKTPLYWVLH